MRHDMFYKPDTQNSLVKV